VGGNLLVKTKYIQASAVGGNGVLNGFEGGNYIPDRLKKSNLTISMEIPEKLIENYWN
jgi:hypothetical protein